MGQDVVKVDQTLLLGNASQHPINQPPKSSWSVAQAEEQDLELPVPSVGG